MSRFKSLIIAEVGVNHNGNIGIAKKLINLAKRAGCDFVKFHIEIAPYCPHAQILRGMKQISQKVDRLTMKPPSSVSLTTL